MQVIKHPEAIRKSKGRPMFTATANTRCHNTSHSRIPGFSTLLGLYRQRRALAEMDTQRLADIGLSRAEADAEAKRPIWDVPHYWRR